jgi:phospholipid/cholesterol/gamma-HCH transport system ATP-binding protein
MIDIHAALGGAWVLRGVSLAAPRGRITAILGPSGVGKTTCLRMITGLLEPDEGDILIDGRSTQRMTKKERMAVSKRFGVLLQGGGLYGSALWESMTVEDNLIHQLTALRAGRPGEMQARAREWLEMTGLSSSAGLSPATLSAGMRRRLALARALIGDPEYAVLDSFELGVDPVRLGELIKLVARSHERTDGTYVIATQSMRVARELADELVVLWRGHVIEQGPAGRVLNSEQPEVHQLINGLVEGPMDMGGEVRRPAQGAQVSNRKHIEEQFELPVPLVAIALLVIATASALYLGRWGSTEIVLVVVLWFLTLLALALRRPGG